MANYSTLLERKNSNTGVTDRLNVRTEAKVVDFNNEESSLASVEVEGAIKELDSNITAINQNIADMPQIFVGTIDPTNDIGVDGDIYIKVVE